MDKSLSRKQFTLLAAMAQADGPLTQRELSALVGHSLSSVNRVMKELCELGYADDRSITTAGRRILAPYRARKAVILASDVVPRLLPITLSTPAPLIRVQGVPIIEPLLEAVLAAGIEDITIVRGYLAEQFDQLLYKYPMVKFLENPRYNEEGSIASALCVGDGLSNAYVLDGRLLLRNPGVIQKYHYGSAFLGVPMARCDRRCFTVREDCIHDLQTGGLDCFRHVGVSYWSDADGKQLARHLRQAYDLPGGHELDWEQVPLKIFKKDYKVGVCACSQEDIVEIDSFRELKAIDKTYDV